VQKIRFLGEDLIGKIAAGEVVENPASVVKELIENAIDAHASEIRIEVEEGGKKKITVSDNGSGMSAEDARIAWQRHTTSKISSADDLFAIKTLGFRGEALASIAAVSKLTILTRDSESETGIELHIENGKIVSERVCGMNAGTTIVVSQLFYNTPARLKHLKSERVELLRIVDVVVRYAIAMPQIRFTLSTEHGNVFTKNPDSDERAGLIPVIGLEGAKSLIKMGWKDGRVEISGYISKPEIQKSTSDYIYLYVNRRWFYSKNIVNAIRDACGESLMKGKYPIAIIFISVPFEDVDVNVHPAKTEVRFVDERSIINSIAGAVRAAFARHREHEAILREVHEKGAQQTLAVESTGTAAQPAVVKEAITAYAVSHPAGIVEEKTKVKIRVIGQALNSYIIGEISQTSEAFSGKPFQEASPPENPSGKNSQGVKEGVEPHLPKSLQGKGESGVREGAESHPVELVVVDQHAACERIAYEALRNFEKVVKQELIVPLVVELTPKEAKTLEEYRELLASLGFEIEDFGLRTFTVRSVPSVASMIATKELFIEMLDSLGEGKAQDAEGKIEQVLKTIACKSAIKSGEPLSVEKMYEILNALYKCKLPFNCPHGRPTVLKYQKKDLDRMFLR